jgi:hypothetical protein
LIAVEIDAVPAFLVGRLQAARCDGHVSTHEDAAASGPGEEGVSSKLPLAVSQDGASSCSATACDTAGDAGGPPLLPGAALPLLPDALRLAGGLVAVPLPSQLREQVVALYRTTFDLPAAPQTAVWSALVSKKVCAATGRDFRRFHTWCLLDRRAGGKCTILKKVLRVGPHCA